MKLKLTLLKFTTGRNIRMTSRSIIPNGSAADLRDEDHETRLEYSR